MHVDGARHRRRTSSAIRVLVALLCTTLIIGGTGGGWYMWAHHWRRITITVNGDTHQIPVDTTTAKLLDDNGDFGTKPGQLLAVDNTMLEATGGEPIRVTINGTPVDNANLNRTTFPDDALVNVTSGKNLFEDHTVRKEIIPYQAEINLEGGPLQKVVQRGANGEREIWTGKRSKKEADRGVTRDVKNLIIKAFAPQPAGRKVMALTFDDGPSAHSNAILDILKAKGVKATFFNVGQNAIDYASVEKRALAEGHQVASHSNTHVYLPKLSIQNLRTELWKGFENIKVASGVETRIMRAPYGAFGVEQWKSVADFVDMNVLWDIDTLDWTRPGSRAIHNAVVSNARNGAVVLMHDGGGDRSQDVEALPGIIDDLKAQGYEFVTIDQLAKTWDNADA
ncbi:polysaccharide deacetylase family protein [Bifidobacterium sp. 64T4]|nr:polysaccharide deacetylase family protein [Bifidobacterium pongonis]